MKAAATFRPAIVIGLITAGLISFAAFIALLGWGGYDDEDHRPGSGALPASSAVGYKGLMTLAASFVEAEAVARPEDFDSYDLLVVPLRADDDPADVAALLRRRRSQPTLLILPKWVVARDPMRPGWVRAIGPNAWSAGSRLLGEGYEVRQVGGGNAAKLMGFEALEGVDAPMPANPQVVRGDGVEDLLWVPGQGALVGQLGRQPHYVVADPDLVNNQGLRTPAGARTALAILGGAMPDATDRILFATSVKGPEAPPGRNLLRSMFEPPFLAMTIALLIAALLAGLHGVGRFGPVRPPERSIPFGKAALVENSAGLVRLAGREVRLGGAYADLVRDEAGREGAAPPTLQGEALEAYLDRFTRPGETPFRALASDLRAARDKGELIAAARALFKWKKDIIR